jgi:hypothetical protein
MFAALTFDHEPHVLTWSSVDFWVQTVGGFAAVAMAIWLLMYLIGGGRRDPGSIMAQVGWLLLVALLFSPLAVIVILLYSQLGRGGASIGGGDAPRVERRSTLFQFVFLGAALGSLSIYLGVLPYLYGPELIARVIKGEAYKRVPPENWRFLAQEISWTVAGALAILAVLLPMIADLPRFSLRRIWGLARLTFKEAMRRKIVWVFAALLLIVLFASWFIPAKPEDQVRNYVTVVFVAKALLLLLAAGLLASFGIPDDMRQQTIHTVLTKPVQRFEIFLGRFVGYMLLMSLVLGVVSALGLVYVLRNIDPDAQAESLKARVPVYGELEYEGTPDRKKGENVGREWEYRGYIMGTLPGQPPQFALWNFATIPADLGKRDKVRMEFTLDIYRTYKGEEGKGVACTFAVESWRWQPSLKSKYDEKKAEYTNRGDTNVEDKLAEEFGYFEYPGMVIQDYHNQFIDVPAGVFRNALGSDDKLKHDLLQRPGAELPPAVRVRVRCENRSQFVGMAKHDLYLRQDDHNAGATVETFRFGVNYFKGAYGLWLRLCLVIALAVALSTYLSGVISLLTTGVLFVLGFVQDFIAEVAKGEVAGGGAVRSAMRLGARPGGESPAAELPDTAATRVASVFDQVFNWCLARFMNLIPTVDRFSFTDWVAEGVAISGAQMFTASVLLLAYILPWVVLAYYLLKWREVASSS